MFFSNYSATFDFGVLWFFHNTLQCHVVVMLLWWLRQYSS